jgi:molybdopterin synthase sulfur carrier subunit
MARVLYFGAIPDLLKKTSENVMIASSINTVHDLLVHLRQQGEIYNQVMHLDKVQVTVNKQFAEGDSAVKNDDEIAIISIGLLK